MSRLSDRLKAILEHHDWSGRELGRRAGIAPTYVSGLIKRFEADPDTSVETKTLEAIARAAGVSPEWLQHGRGEPGWADAPPVDDPSPDDAGAPGPDVPDAVSQPPATYGAIPGYAALEKGARRIARDLTDEWIWSELRDANPLRNSRVPLTPASLAAIARVIAEYGVPPADQPKNAAKRS